MLALCSVCVPNGGRGGRCPVHVKVRLDHSPLIRGDDDANFIDSSGGVEDVAEQLLEMEVEGLGFRV